METNESVVRLEGSSEAGAQCSRVDVAADCLRSLRRRVPLGSTGLDAWTDRHLESWARATLHHEEREDWLRAIRECCARLHAEEPEELVRLLADGWPAVARVAQDHATWTCYYCGADTGRTLRAFREHDYQCHLCARTRA